MLRSNASRHRSLRGLLRLLLFVSAVLAVPAVALAQGSTPVGTASPPIFWYLLAAALALLVPAGLVLLSVAGLDPWRAWQASLAALVSLALITVAYWAVGFALQFGGIGLAYPQVGLRNLVWEWSPLSAEWGIGWGMAGLSGWFLSGPEVTTLAYALFLSHLPWALTAALVPLLALRERAPATATFVIALLMGGVIYPLAGNWVQGGGWLSALGRNLELGHGFIDFGGAGTVFLVAAGFALAALVLWSPRRSRVNPAEVALPPPHLPLLAVVGALLVLAGAIGWLWANPLQVIGVSELALLRGSVNILMSAAGGALIPLLYTWFVTGEVHPTLSSRGLAAGMVAGLAAGPFVQPGPAFLIGLLAGGSLPFVTYLTDRLLGLDDATGAIAMAGVPALIGLLLVALLADGVAGSGWQMAGLESYLGVPGQGVSGLWVAAGFTADFPGQLQAQLIGMLTLGLWGFLSGLVICIPLSLLVHSLRQRSLVDAPR